MPAVLFGVETEYAATLVAANGRRMTDRAAASALLTQASKIPSLPEGSGHGVFIGNSSRVYVDSGYHPELSTPEVASPRDAVLYCAAGDRLMAQFVRGVGEKSRLREALVTKCNVDYSGTGNTWGCHESYLYVKKDADLAKKLIPHLVTRIVYTGAGGFDNTSHGLRFLISPRVPHLVCSMSYSSTEQRGIFHTKNEPLCAPPYSRLHLLVGESLNSHLATYLKIGTTALVVAAVAGGDGGSDAGAELNLEFADPVRAMRTFSRDPSCTAQVALADGGAIGATAVQYHYLQAVEKRLHLPGMPDWAEEVCSIWREVLDSLVVDPTSMCTRLDWAIKYALFRRRTESKGVDWDSLGNWAAVMDALDLALRKKIPEWEQAPPDALLDSSHPIGAQLRRYEPILERRNLEFEDLPKILALRAELFELDIRFGDVSEQSPFTKLDAADCLDHRFFTDEAIEAAMENPPSGSRAKVRGETIHELHKTRRRYLCTWDRIDDYDGERHLDLRDPFAKSAKWRKFEELSEREAAGLMF